MSNQEKTDQDRKILESSQAIDGVFSLLGPVQIMIW